MRSSLTRLALVAAAVSVTAGCGGPGSSPRRPEAARATGSAQPPNAEQTASPSAAPGSGTKTGTGGVKGSTPGSSGTAGAGSAAPSNAASAPAKQQQAQTPPAASAQEIPISATVTPACVPAGGTATLHVKTVPSAIVAYVAEYAGAKSGAAPPFGYGYGGNDHGESDAEGSWSHPWVVRADAPVGRGRVIVVVGRHGKNRQIDVPFSVGAREVGGCGTS